jgi:hypothetical protein
MKLLGGAAFIECYFLMVALLLAVDGLCTSDDDDEGTNRSIKSVN